ncbi:MAG: hypothetical protein ABIO02_04830 [Patescibacteria group bacterium]
MTIESSSSYLFGRIHTKPKELKIGTKIILSNNIPGEIELRESLQTSKMEVVDSNRVVIWTEINSPNFDNSSEIRDLTVLEKNNVNLETKLYLGEITGSRRRYRWRRSYNQESGLFIPTFELQAKQDSYLQATYLFHQLYGDDLIFLWNLRGKDLQRYAHELKLNGNPIQLMSAHSTNSNYVRDFADYARIALAANPQWFMNMDDLKL